MSEPRRSPLYLITGLVIGIVVGVLYSWLWLPVEALEAHPSDLRADFKNSVRELIARAYVSNSDLGRAEARLALLGDSDPERELAVQAQLSLGEDGSADAARALGILAAHLESGQESTEIAIAYPRTATPSGGSSGDQGAQPTMTPRLSSTPRPVVGNSPTRTVPPQVVQPSPTATATQGAPFALVDFALVCDEDITSPLIQVYVFDAAGNPVPGVGILLVWDGGINRFVTGLKPEFGLGYADFEMDPAVSYTLRLEDGGDPVDGLTGKECDGGFLGSWRLNFTQP